MNNIVEHFYQHTHQLAECANLRQLETVCGRYLYSLGGQFFKYAWTPPTISGDPQPVAFFTCPEPWLQQYAQQGYGRTDPKFRHCQQSQHAVEWDAQCIGSQVTQQRIRPQDRAFWRDTLDMGMANGATIPIRGIAGSTGMLCIAYEGAYVPRESAPLPLLEAWAMHVHTHVERLHVKQQLRSPLTRREQEVLKWTVLGKTADGIGDTLHISSNTVLFHLGNLRRKFGVANKHHLIAKALALGLVNF